MIISVRNVSTEIHIESPNLIYIALITKVHDSQNLVIIQEKKALSRINHAELYTKTTMVSYPMFTHKE